MKILRDHMKELDKLNDTNSMEELRLFENNRFNEMNSLFKDLFTLNLSNNEKHEVYVNYSYHLFRYLDTLNVKSACIELCLGINALSIISNRMKGVEDYA